MTPLPNGLFIQNATANTALRGWA